MDIPGKHEISLFRSTGFQHTKGNDIDSFVYALINNDIDFLTGFNEKVWETTCTLSEDPVRNIQNLIIASCATNQLIARHSGVPTEIALSTSDIFINKSQKLHDIKILKKIYFSLAIAYSDLIKRYRIPPFSRKVKQAIEYINQNIFEPIKVYEIAEALQSNAAYISEIFRKETGVTIKKYIHTTKIEEAKTLMTYTSLNMSEIASHLGYNDLSHFHKVCRLYTGLSPKQLAKKAGILSNIDEEGRL